MSVPSFTTPTFTFSFSEDGLDLTQAISVYVTFQGSMGLITKTGEDLTIGEKTVSVSLSQEETGKFGVESISMQVNWTLPNGLRAASNVVAYNISKQLLLKVVE